MALAKVIQLILLGGTWTIVMSSRRGKCYLSRGNIDKVGFFPVHNRLCKTIWKTPSCFSVFVITALVQLYLGSFLLFRCKCLAKFRESYTSRVTMDCEVSGPTISLLMKKIFPGVIKWFAWIQICCKCCDQNFNVKKHI